MLASVGPGSGAEPNKQWRVSAPGEVEPASGGIKIGSSVPGRIAEVLVKPGDTVSLRQGSLQRVVVVKGLSGTRGPAPVAQQLYEETPESVARREAQAAERKLHREPALAIEQGRPTKRDRRQLADWNRWSASADSE